MNRMPLVDAGQMRVDEELVIPSKSGAAIEMRRRKLLLSDTVQRHTACSGEPTDRVGLDFVELIESPLVGAANAWVVVSGTPRGHDLDVAQNLTGHRSRRHGRKIVGEEPLG